MTILHHKITQAGLIAIAVNLITQTVSLVPQWAPYKAQAIDDVGYVLGAAFLVAHILYTLIGVIEKALANKAAIPGELEHLVDEALEHKLAGVDLNEIAKNALADKLPNLDELKTELEAGVKTEVARVLSAAAGATT